MFPGRLKLLKQTGVILTCAPSETTWGSFKQLALLGTASFKTFLCINIKLKRVFVHLTVPLRALSENSSAKWLQRPLCL